MIRVGIIGYGYWGPNLARCFHESSDSEVVAISDFDAERLSTASQRYPGVECVTDFNEVLANPKVDAIAIATPVESHYELALKSLQESKHVLVEKPLASSSEQCQRLIEEASRRDLVLTVDHTFVYTGAVRKIHDLISEGTLGQLYYYDSVRVNLGIFQHDVNVLWDLAVHDLSIMDYIVQESPCAVSATGISHVEGEPENIGYMTLFFPSSMIAHVHVNWLAPAKVRRTLIGGDKQMIIYDDLEPSEKVKVYDKGIAVRNGRESVFKLLVSYRMGDMWAPRIDLTEALRVEAGNFLQCIQDRNAVSHSDGTAGLRIVQILEAASKSMALNGQPQELNLS